MKIERRVEAQVAKGNEKQITNLLDKLESKVELPLELQEKLEKLGNTPIEEEMIYKAILAKAEDGLVSIVANILSKEDIEKLPASTVGDFIHAVIQKVSSTKDDEGNFKSTPDTKECDMPNAFEIEDIVNLSVKAEKARQVFISEDTGDKEKSFKKFEKLNTALDKKIMEVTKLDADKLTDWEKQLVIEMTFETVKGFRNHAQGKRFQV